jgi:hypothetical protein
MLRPAGLYAWPAVLSAAGFFDTFCIAEVHIDCASWNMGIAVCLLVGAV